MVLQGFRTLKPASQVTRYVDLWERLWDDEYVAAYQAMTAWSDDHVPFPGPRRKRWCGCSCGTTASSLTG